MLNLEVKNGIPAVAYAFPMETMGDRIRTLRISRGWTQEQLGRLVGVSKGAISHWEIGASKDIKLETFLTLLKVLGTDFEYLIWGEERAPSGVVSRRVRGGSKS